MSLERVIISDRDLLSILAIRKRKVMVDDLPSLLREDLGNVRVKIHRSGKKIQLTERQSLRLFAQGLGTAIVDKLPDWMKLPDMDDFSSVIDLINACREGISEDIIKEWQNEMLQTPSYEEAIEVCFTFLKQSGIKRPKKYLIARGVRLPGFYDEILSRKSV